VLLRFREGRIGKRRRGRGGYNDKRRLLPAFSNSAASGKYSSGVSRGFAPLLAVERGNCQRRGGVRLVVQLRASNWEGGEGEKRMGALPVEGGST